MTILTAAGNAAAADEVTVQLAGGLHYASGYGGIGYAALIGLLVVRGRDRAGVLTHAFAACGQRSLSCYLTQSILFVAFLAPYTGRLGQQLGLTTTTLAAIGVWTVTVTAADLMRRHHHRGPAEVLLRHLTYRSSPTSRQPHSQADNKPVQG